MQPTFSLTIPDVGAGTPLESAVEIACQRKRIELTGTKGGSLARLLALLSERRERLLIVVESSQEARSIARDLVYHRSSSTRRDASAEVLIFPDFESGPYDRLTPDRRKTLERAAALFKLTLGLDWRFMIATAGATLRKTIPKKEFEEACFPVSAGQRVERDPLLKCLERGGYHRCQLVEDQGTYAVRGSLIDIFPPYLERPVRIDLLGSSVEQIRSFDPSTQRTEGQVREIWVHPARLALLPATQDEQSAVAERIRNACDAVNQPTGETERLIADALEGRLLPGNDGLVPAFYQTLGQLFDYLPSDLAVCLNNPAGIRLAWQKTESSLAADHQRCISEKRPSFPPERHLVSSAEIEASISGFPTLSVHNLPVADGKEGDGERGGETIDIGSFSTDDVGERLKRSAASEGSVDIVGSLARYLADLEAKGYRTTLVSHTNGQAERLASMLTGRGIEVELQGSGADNRFRPGVSIGIGGMARGCLLPADGLCWIAEEEVFGRRLRRRSAFKQSHVSLGDLRLLQPNDLVVHADHGIGRYKGLVRQQVRSSEMDFLLIEYYGGDKLYLPVHRLNQIQKYKGGEGEQRLDRLGGQTFAKTKEEVKRAAADMAGHLLGIYARRAAVRRDPLGSSDDLYRAFEAEFPFEETDDQLRAIEEVMADLDADKPMDRLVCGDVGFGKTEVAVRAAFRTAMSGRQTAILVPTTVLAQQHYQTLSGRFSPYPIRVETMSRFRSDKENQEVIRGLKEGSVDIAIGTHRMLSKDVHFKNLGLLVIDEEHRFGVAHKERIRALSASVDTMMLSATPIPRTLHMALGGIRDLSLIATAPADRHPIQTLICYDDPMLLKKVMERELARNGQVFFVHNRVRNIEQTAERIRMLMPQARVAVGHGQKKEEELERVMLDFVAGSYDILVCTAIIESGLDIPRANTIVIDRADTFGLAQLYQLRGRVGRSSQQAYAYLVVPPLEALGDEARQRVETLARYTDLGSGFSVSTMDLEIRGAGDLLGPEQSGNVRAVGFDMFCELLAEAAAELRGEVLQKEIEPELNFERPGLIPEMYVPDVGQRLQYYKRLASAAGEEEIESIAAELVDCFGGLPRETEELVEVMNAKALCRRLKIPGIEATKKRMVLHLSIDSAVDPDAVVRIVREDAGRVRLTDDLKIQARFDEDDPGGASGAIRLLHRLEAYGNS